MKLLTDDCGNVISDNLFIIQPGDDNRLTWREAQLKAIDNKRKYDEELVRKFFLLPSDTDDSFLDKLFSEHKENGEVFHILFINTNSFDHDPWTKAFWDVLINNYSGSEPVYIIDAWECPNSGAWKSFKVSTTPKLVTSFVKFFVEEEYLPNIYTKLGLVVEKVEDV
jgi:hypothetical protein